VLVLSSTSLAWGRGRFIVPPGISASWYAPRRDPLQRRAESLLRLHQQILWHASQAWHSVPADLEGKAVVALERLRQAHLVRLSFEEPVHEEMRSWLGDRELWWTVTLHASLAELPRVIDILQPVAGEVRRGEHAWPHLRQLAGRDGE
jgi:hypothetical protein